MKGKVLSILVIIVMLFFLITDVFAQGCSQCRLVPQANQNGGGTVGSTLNPAILYLMAVPYVILFLIFRKQIVGLYRNLRNKKAV